MRVCKLTNRIANSSSGLTRCALGLLEFFIHPPLYLRIFLMLYLSGTFFAILVDEGLAMEEEHPPTCCSGI